VILCPQCGSALRDNDRFCAACGSVAGNNGASKDPLLGRTIGGSYVVLDLVGVGGMGRVYRAEQRMLGRTVAIKVIHPHLLSDEQSVARFYNEARAASRLNHPNSVSIIDFGRTDDGILYLAMEYLQGRDLARLMREEGPLPFGRICDIVAAVLAALGEAHVLGVIHRDLKPENVIIERLRTGSDLVKVVDFGLAKLLGPAHGETSVTSPGLVCGTPDYMSPEQGRGLPLDGRGDLYSVGVMLFELLTEQLPYIADTPTNVVLRHIQDPIPDPRETSPERRIPGLLCNVVERALAKQPEARYQSAPEMADELRRAWQELQPTTREVICQSCGTRSPSTKRFCGECGAALQSHPTPAAARPRMSLPPRMNVAVNEQSRLVARDLELEQLARLRQDALGRSVTVCVIGEAGIGKTRLLAAAAERADAEGDLIVGAGPHDSGALIPYHPIRTIMLSLLATDGPGLWRKLEELTDTLPLVAAGMREVLEPTGLRGAEGRSRAGAVAAALAHSLHVAMRAMDKERALLIIDDMDRCDGLSSQVLVELPQHTARSSLLLLTASQYARKEEPQSSVHTIVLRPLTMSEARACMGGYNATPQATSPEAEERAFAPLYLEQLRALGLAVDGVPHTLPRRLADAVMQRMQRLSLPARRMLQAASVLGNRSSRDQLMSLAELDDFAGFELLKSSGLLAEQDGQIEVVHPFIRDLVEASIPAEARKALHARALEAAADADAPLEVRAHHAYGAGETLTALMLLERMGDLASDRGDADSAVSAFRRCLDLVRRELLELGETSLEDAMASFSRKLGVALARAGDLTGAEGVLREALEFCPPASSARALVLLGLGRVVANRKRLRDAYRMLGEALELAIQREDDTTQAAVHMTIGSLRRSEGNLVGAMAAFSTALQRLSGGPDSLAVARAAVELAMTVAQGNDPQAAEDALRRAQELARAADSPYLEACTSGALAVLHSAQGEKGFAENHLRRACAAALKAGDAEGYARYERAFEPAETAITERARPSSP
jgi:serine/threonine protein kinase/tetratricopeptide (TPR) repeat protein